MIGEIHPPKTLFLRNNVGTADGPDGPVYEMTYSMTGTPIVRHLGTKKWFTLDWNDIIKLAEEAGINKDE